MTLTIPDVDEFVEQRLRAQAASHGRTVQAEAREILKLGVAGNRQAAEDQKSLPDTESPSFKAMIGIWEGRGTTDEMMKELRGED